MYAEMICKCESSFSIDFEDDNEDAAWHLIWRFANAHAACGYVSPGKPSKEDNETFKKRPIKPRRRLAEEEEEEDE